MKDVSLLTAKDILSYKEPESLYSGIESDATKEYRKLAMLWHTDRNPSADPLVFAHISSLYKKALEKIKSGVWIIPGVLRFTDSVTNTEYEIKYKKKHSFELGEMYIGVSIVTYCIDDANKDLFDNAVKQMNNFSFADDKMKTEMMKNLPVIIQTNTVGDKHYVLVKKDPQSILLKDLIEHMGGKLDSKHAAWITSVMYNIACYLKYAGIVHCSINTDTLFINPDKHSGQLLGGWWYAVKEGTKLIAAPSKTVNYGPYDILTKKLGKHSIDTNLIKATCREILGDIGGSKLNSDKSIPEALITWISLAGKENTFEEYKGWGTVLKNSFGARRFVELPVKLSDVYKD